MQRFNCSNTAASEGVSRREPPHIARSLDPLLRRSAAQCTQANCMCGLPGTYPSSPIQNFDCLTNIQSHFQSLPGAWSNHPSVRLQHPSEWSPQFDQPCVALPSHPPNETDLNTCIIQPAPFLFPQVKELHFSCRPARPQ